MIMMKLTSNHPYLNSRTRHNVHLVHNTSPHSPNQRDLFFMFLFSLSVCSLSLSRLLTQEVSHSNSLKPFSSRFSLVLPISDFFHLVFSRGNDFDIFCILRPVPRILLTRLMNSNGKRNDDWSTFDNGARVIFILSICKANGSPVSF